jgi:hypothetical protein
VKPSFGAVSCSHRSAASAKGWWIVWPGSARAMIGVRHLIPFGFLTNSRRPVRRERR